MSAVCRALPAAGCSSVVGSTRRVVSSVARMAPAGPPSSRKGGSSFSGIVGARSGSMREASGNIGGSRSTGVCSSSASAAEAPRSSNGFGALDSVAAHPAMQPLVSLVASIVTFVIAVMNKARDAMHAALPQLDDAKAQAVQAQINAVGNTVRLAAFIAPFAKAAASESLTAVYTRTFERAAFGFAKMYLFCLFMRVLLSWFPSIDWNSQPWTFLRLITEPYLQIYRGILPPLFGQLDFTPLFGFLILQDVVEVMAPTYTMGMHGRDTSSQWTTSDVMCYFDGF